MRKYFYKILTSTMLLLVLWIAVASAQSTIYKVQISSGREDAGKLERLTEKYNFAYPIEERFINGRYKYLVGSFDTYEEAKTYRNVIINDFGIYDAFVTQVKAEQPATHTAETVESTPESDVDEPFNEPNENIEEEVVEEEPEIEGSDTIEYFGWAEAFVPLEPVFRADETTAKKKSTVETKEKKEEEPAKTEVSSKNKKNWFSVKEWFKRDKKTPKKEEKEVKEQPKKKEAKPAKKTEPEKKKTEKPKKKTGVSHKIDSTIKKNVEGMQKEENVSNIAEENTDQTGGDWGGGAVDSSQTVAGIASEVKENVKKNEYLPFPQNIIKPVIYVIETTFNSNKIIILAVIMIFYFQLTFIFLVIFIVIARFVRSTREAKKEQIRERYQNIIADYLFSDDSENVIPPDLLKIKSNMRAELLLEEVLLLHRNLSGETYERLIKLYFELSLQTYSIKKLNKRQWHKVAKGIRELSQMDVTTSLRKIEELVDSSNDIIRMEAQLALIRLNKQNPFGFLDSYSEEMNEWEKLNIHHLIETHKIEVPRFKKWLKSHNDHVVIFCIQMITIYKQSDAYDELIALLEHPNKEINRRTIIAFGELRETRASETLKNIFGQAYLQNKIRIIRALGQIGDEANVLFLENLLDDNDFDIRFEAASAMKEIGGSGMMILLDRLSSGDEELQTIVKHVMDERI